MNLRISILLVGLVAISCSTDKKPDSISGNNLDTIVDKSLETAKKPNKGTDRIIEKIKVDSNLFTEIILTADSLVDEIEDATFNKIIIKKGEKVVFELYDENAYDSIESRAIKIKNEINSKNLLLQ
jgi:hypothetical protein